MIRQRRTNDKMSHCMIFFLHKSLFLNVYQVPRQHFILAISSSRCYGRGSRCLIKNRIKDHHCLRYNEQLTFARFLNSTCGQGTYIYSLCFQFLCFFCFSICFCLIALSSLSISLTYFGVASGTSCHHHGPKPHLLPLPQ